MTGEPEETSPAGPRAGDRRGKDRRRVDRRAPVPPWRRPWAYVAYGVGVALVAILALTRFNRDEAPAPAGLETAPSGVAVDTVPPPAANAPVQDARSTADYERLVAEGSTAAGQKIRTILYCRSIHSVTLIQGKAVTPSVQALSDAKGQVPGAECTWSASPDAPDFLLLVPPALAESFGMLPQVDVGFVRRRRVPAEVEWIGRSEALALRVGGVLKDLSRR